jgi:Hemocyanin, ig-like domain
MEPANSRDTCSNAASYCGIRNEKYPDLRAMGYPFDRLPRTGVDTLQKFLTPNMGVQNVSIRFNDITVDNTPNNGQQPRDPEVSNPQSSPFDQQPPKTSCPQQMSSEHSVTGRRYGNTQLNYKSNAVENSNDIPNNIGSRKQKYNTKNRSFRPDWIIGRPGRNYE